VAGKTVGVLALQGDFEAHRRFLENLGLGTRPIRKRAELEGLDGLVLPGGESTAMLRLMESEGLFEALGSLLGGGLPVLATCAGLILLARKVEPEQKSLGILDVDVRRNAYGRQLHSSIVKLRIPGRDSGDAEGVFIRAPRISRVGPGVRVLAWREDDPLLVGEGSLLAASFHPELGRAPWVHRIFLEVL